MKDSKREMEVDVLEKDDRISEMVLCPKAYVATIILGFIIIIGCIILNFGIGCSMLLIFFEINLFMGLLLEIDAKRVYELYKRFKNAYKNIETETLEVHTRYGVNKFYTNFKRNFNFLKIMTLISVIATIVGYIALSFACNDSSIDQMLIGKIQNITTAAVTVLCGIGCCYSNALYKKSFIQRYQFMCNYYVDLCEAYKNRTSQYK